MLSFFIGDNALIHFNSASSSELIKFECCAEIRAYIDSTTGIPSQK